MGRGMVADELRERVAALKHDLGKYVAWMSANLEPALWEGPVQDLLIDALVRDVLETNERNGRSEPAWEVWQRLTSDWRRPLPAPELGIVRDAVVRLQQAEPALRARDREAIGRLRGDIRSAQHDIRANLATLHRRLQRESS